MPGEEALRSSNTTCDSVNATLAGPATGGTYIVPKKDPVALVCSVVTTLVSALAAADVPEVIISIDGFYNIVFCINPFWHNSMQLNVMHHLQ